MKQLAFVLTVMTTLACVGCSSTKTSHTAGHGSETASTTEVIPLQYIAADSAAATLQAQQADAKIIAERHMNAIIVAASPEQIEKIRHDVKRVDQLG